jgi:hypothetical protein
MIAATRGVPLGRFAAHNPRTGMPRVKPPAVASVRTKPRRVMP